MLILPDPHYACYPSFITLADGIPRYVSVLEEDGFHFRPEAIAPTIGKRTRAILVNSPSNPAGTVLDRERMAALATPSSCG